MSQVLTETLTVKQITKYGFQGSDGVYVNWSNKLDDSEKGKVIPGGTYEFVLFVADSGKKYVNEVKGQAVNKVPAAVPAKKAATEVPMVNKSSKGSEMSKSEWQAKDRSQLIGGLSHDAASLAAAIVHVKGNSNPEQVLEVYKVLLVGMLEIRDEVK